MKSYREAPCWVIRDADDGPWDDERDVHFPDQEIAETEIDDIRADHEDDLTPEQYAEHVTAAVTTLPGSERQASYERALKIARQEAGQLASLHPVMLPATCYTVACDHEGCTAEPQGDGEFSHLHFDDQRYPFNPDDHDWRTASGRDYCDDHGGLHLCVECDGLLGEGAAHEGQTCAGCLVSPGPGDVPLSIGSGS